MPMEKKSLNSPDEIRIFPKGKVELVTIRARYACIFPTALSSLSPQAFLKEHQSFYSIPGYPFLSGYSSL